MAELDLPAVLKYINAQTNRKIHYVGHSQGGMIGIIALQNPNVSQLIRKADFLVKVSMQLILIITIHINTMITIIVDFHDLKFLESTSSLYFTSKSTVIQVHCSIYKKLKVKHNHLNLFDWMQLGLSSVMVNLATCQRAWKLSLPSYAKIIMNYVEQHCFYFVVLKKGA